MGELLTGSDTLAPATFERVRAYLKQLAGIDLASNKVALVQGRLHRQVAETTAGDFDRYLNLVEADPGEQQRFISALTTNVTDFFRERHHFQALKTHLRERAHPGPATIWSAACSTGEEVWSIAMTLYEEPYLWRVLATDIDVEVVETARAGVYPMERVANLPPDVRKQFFDRSPDQTLVRVKDALRPPVSLGQLNLMHDWPMKGPFDAIFCRNVLIYFDAVTRQRVVSRLAQLLRPGGLLFLGHSESMLGADVGLEPCGATTFRRPEAN